MAAFDTDYLIIGSGFGGSVSALRLAQKGYRVLVVEQGRRFAPRDMPESTRNLRRFLWLPSLFCRRKKCGVAALGRSCAIGRLKCPGITARRKKCSA